MPSPAQPPPQPQPWPRFLRTALASLAMALALAGGLIAVMNPYGNLPVRAFGGHVIMDTNDRFQYPAIVRSRRFDSVVLGSSTARLLDPARLEAALGGRFANLALNDGRAWEQMQLASLFLATEPRPQTLLIGLDWVWCAGDADTAPTSPTRIFPHWIYDADPWNDLAHLLNGRALETALRQLGYRVGLLPARFPANGFDVFVPPETAYDAGKAQRNIWRGLPRVLVPATPAYLPGQAERQAWTYPALAWLEELLVKTPVATRKVLAFMPVHIAAQPQPASAAAAREAECKVRIAAIAARHGAHLVDFRIASSITAEDANYWDALHYRLPIAQRLPDSIGTAVTTGRDDPRGDWRYLAGPPRH